MAEIREHVEAEHHETVEVKVTLAATYTETAFVSESHDDYDPEDDDTLGTTTTTTTMTSTGEDIANDRQSHIGIDDGTSDGGDSAIEEQISNLTQSLTSSVVDYPFEHGRRYHAYHAGSYLMPNDEKELDRLDFNHALMVKGIGEKLYLAPINEQKIHRILDIGTGTGIWAIEMGDQLPHVEVRGNDLSAIQPFWVPPNVKFEVDDVESLWEHPIPFDYIFCRYMAGCIGNWPMLTRNIYANMSTGGWAEFQDYRMQYYSEDGSLNESHSTLQWINTLLDASRKMGREPDPGPKLEGWVRAAGFQNIGHHKFKFPIGPWPREAKLKEIGLLNLIQIVYGLEAFSLRVFCDALGWKEEELQVLLANVRRELKSGSIHAVVDFHVVYGQKL